jgi:hypothetical protein
MKSMLLGLAGVTTAIWVYLLLARGGFWRMHHSTPDGKLPSRAPRIVAVIPARNEAAVVGRAIESLAKQEYPGEFHIVLVDDDSSDGTAEAARCAAPAGLLEVVRAALPYPHAGAGSCGPFPRGSGKRNLWSQTTTCSPTQTSCIRPETWPRW